MEVRVLPPQLSSQRFLFPELLVAAAILAAGFAGMLPFSATPVLLVFGVCSLWLRGEPARAVGLAFRADWRRTVLVGAGAGIGYQGFSLYIAEPAIARLTGKLPDVSLFAPLAGNVHFLLISLAVAWTLAACGEEFVYRGFLLRRIAQALGDGSGAWRSALVATSVLFGVGHGYQGLSGMITAGLGGFAFGLLYLASRRNLWVSVIAHGTMDTVGFLLLFLGKYPGS
ncbi:MAG TPA: CPBP family intramembrane glutamic endopeptidase [Gemmatimonadales bacterium]|nr:CPBP family intramembrane glutamic endopeptidase [Gemmatimonadales bacterium]